MKRIEKLTRWRRDDRKTDGKGDGPGARKTALRIIGFGTLAAALGRWTRALRRRTAVRNGAIARRERILEAIGSGAEQLLRSTDPARLTRFIGVLGRATGASRVYVFENYRDEHGELAAAQRFEWVAPGVTPTIDDPELQAARYDSWGLRRWRQTLERGTAFLGRINEVPKIEREVMKRQEIQSLIMLPIFIGPEWWGFIGFDETRWSRRWSAAEVSALKTSAGLVAASIERDRADERMQQLQRARVEGEAAKAAERRSRFLAEAGRVFGSTLRYEEILQQLARLAVPELGEWCIIDVVRGGRTFCATVAHADPRAHELAAWIRRSTPPRTASSPIITTLESGKARVVPRMTDAMLREHDAIGDEQLGRRPALVVPLRARGRVVAAVTLLGPQSGRYEPTDLAFAENVAGRASLGLENARLYAKARRATRMRDEMLAIVSHDLRNPLNTISLSLGALRDTPPSDEETRRRQIEIIAKSMQQADRLIRDLLDVARLEAGRLSLDMDRISSIDLAREALELHKGQAHAGVKRLIGVLPDELPDVRADRDRLLQVFGNLLGNAIRFTPEGGQIEVGAELAPDGHVRFHVADTGPGIRADQLPHLFDPFWQATRKGDGAGLGLAIVRGIVEAHGGSIHAESEVSVGTTIYFTIPTAERAGSAPPKVRPQLSRPPRARREAAD